MTYGSDLNFHFVVREDDTGLVLQSETFVAHNQFAWELYNIGTLHYTGSSHDFYMEVIPETTSETCIMGCAHAPVDWRSQRKDDVYLPDWTTIDHDFFVHIFLDDSFIGVEPSSVGRIRAVYR